MIAPPEPEWVEQFTMCDVRRVTVEAIHTSSAPASFEAEQPTIEVSVRRA
jgi:hypothetical protein